jgi:hypothetical protein
LILRRLTAVIPVSDPAKKADNISNPTSMADQMIIHPLAAIYKMYYLPECFVPENDQTYYHCTYHRQKYGTRSYIFGHHCSQPHLPCDHINIDLNRSIDDLSYNYRNDGEYNKKPFCSGNIKKNSEQNCKDSEKNMDAHIPLRHQRIDQTPPGIAETPEKAILS